MATRRPNRRNGRRVGPDEQLRLMTKVARLYHEHDVRQPEIARRLACLAGARVEAAQAGRGGRDRPHHRRRPRGRPHRGSRTSSRRRTAYARRSSSTVSTPPTTASPTTSASRPAPISSSPSPAATSSGSPPGARRSSPPSTRCARCHGSGADRVVQLMGGIGNPAAETHAAHLTQRFSELTGARTDLPGGTRHRQLRLRSAMCCCRSGMSRRRWRRWTSSRSRSSGSGRSSPRRCCSAAATASPTRSREQLGAQGAVGDICLRLFDIDGRPIESQVNERVIAVSLEQLARVDRLIGVAGGPRKYQAIRAALRGRLVNVPITDHADGGAPAGRPSRVGRGRRGRGRCLALVA